MLDKLTAADFRGHAGTTFRAAGTELTLSEVNEGTEQPNAPRRFPFSLVFTAESGAALEQRIHALDHDALGRLELFLVPIQPGPDGCRRYEAVFN